MPVNFIPIAYGLIGALLGVAVTWGRNGETIRQLREAVEKLTAKIEMLSTLQQADALHAQEIAHVRETLTQHDRRLDRLEAATQSMPTPARGIPPR